MKTVGRGDLTAQRHGLAYQSWKQAIGFLMVFLVSMFARSASCAVLSSYEASLGTLPQSQGFGHYADPGYPPATVSGGVLREFRQTGEQTAEYWYVRGLQIDQSASTYTLEADLRIISSNYIPNIGTGPRFGYYLELLTNDGHGYVVGISGSGVALDTDVSFSPNNDFVVSPFNTTNAFHKYKLVVAATGASLYIDGILIATTPPGNSGFGPGRQAGVTFGDASGYGISQSELKSVKVSSLAATLLDPVPLSPNDTSLLDGADITNDYQRLALHGRIVKGVAADGTTQIVLRIEDVSPGEKLRLTLPAPSARNLLGTLRPIGSSSEDFTTVVTATSGSSPAAFAIYRAPLDFADGAMNSDAAQRIVTIRVDRLDGGASTSVPVIIARPALVFVHGFSVDATSWNDFTPLINDTARFAIFKADYGIKLYSKLGGQYQPSTGINILSITPNLNSDVLRSQIRQSHFGFSFNAPAVARQIQTFIQQFNAGLNPILVPLASVQVDVVAHSMGGLIIGYLTTLPTYLSTSNFRQGSVHKLITLGTPHYGSPQAILSLLPQTKCTRDTGATQGRLSFSSAIVSAPSSGASLGIPIPGASFELSGDGWGKNPSNLSSALQRIRSKGTAVPTATLAGDVLSIENGLDSLFGLATLLRIKCPSTDVLAHRYTAKLFDTIFDPAITSANPSGAGIGRRNDGAVPLTSALLDPDATACNSGKCFPGYAHGQKTALFFGASTKHLLDDSMTVTIQVENLLNKSVQDDNIWK
jgi:pimeloyl-ACP methyl ester carboxylesterase